MKKTFGLVLLSASVALGASVSLETFDTDNGVLTANTLASVVVFSAAGGNPGGHIQVRRDLGQSFFDIGAVTTDSRFTGDYGAAGIGSVTVDLNFETANFTAAYFRVRIDSATNGWLFPLTALFPTNTWTTYGTAFDPTWTDLQAKAAGWLTDKDIDPATGVSPSFASVMASVGRAEIRLSTTDESSLAGIDNFGLGAANTPEPSAAVMVSFGLGLLGVWRIRRSR